MAHAKSFNGTVISIIICAILHTSPHREESPVHRFLQKDEEKVLGNKAKESRYTFFSNLHLPS